MDPLSGEEERSREDVGETDPLDEKSCIIERTDPLDEKSCVIERTDPLDEKSCIIEEVTIKKEEPRIDDNGSDDVHDEAVEDKFMAFQPFEEVIIKSEVLDPFDSNEKNHLDADFDIYEESSMKTRPYSDDEETSQSSKLYDKKPVSSKTPVKKKLGKRKEFPRRTDDEVLFLKWLEVCGLNKDANVKWKLICTKHFKTDDYTYGNVGGHLVRSAVPSQALPSPIKQAKPFGVLSSFEDLPNILSSERPGLVANDTSVVYPTLIKKEELPYLPTNQNFNFDTVRSSMGVDQGQLGGVEQSSQTILNTASSLAPVQKTDEFNSSIPLSLENAPIFSRAFDGLNDSDDDTDFKAELVGSESNSSAEDVKESTNQDTLLFCNDCGQNWDGDCPKHGPLVEVSDSTVSMNVEDHLYAIATTPSILRIGNSENPEDAQGVFAIGPISSRMRFGPMEGKLVPRNALNLYTWVLRNNVTKKPYRCLDLSEPGTSNWMRYLRILKANEESNCVVHQYAGQLYLTTIREIAPQEEITVGPYDNNGLLIKYPCIVEVSRDCREALRNDEESSSTSVEKETPIFYCPVCNKWFSRKSHLNRHIRTHSAERPFACPVCDQRYSQKGILSKHMRIHSGERPYACSVCERRFTQKESLNRHMQTHTGERPHMCCVCRKLFTRKTYLEAHLRSHFAVKPIVCSLCHQPFADQGALKKHLTTHNLEKTYVCSECSRCFPHPTDLQRHMRTHTGEKPFVCTECHQGFSQKTSLQRHFKLHTRDKPFVCSICSKLFTRKSYLEVHFNIHLSETPYPCSMCRKRFSNQELLNEHMMCHREKPHVCSVCTRSFPHPTDLQRHMRIHTGEKPFVCSECNQGFSQKTSLQRHWQTHTGEKRYGCPVCYQRYSRNEYLTVHMRVHSEVKPCLCSVCHKRFWDEEILSQHMKAHNVNSKKPYKCVVCNKQYTAKQSLEDHMHIHTGTTPYQCPVCNKRFSLRQSLMNHVQTHNAEILMDSSVCNEEPLLEDASDKLLKTTKEDVAIECPVCNGEFPDMETLRTHLRAHATGEVS